jgi:LysM repeat protein
MPLLAAFIKIEWIRRILMEKKLSVALSIAMLFAIVIMVVPSSPVHATAKQVAQSYTPQKAAKSLKSRSRSVKKRRIARRGGGGCQTLSGSTLQQKASAYQQAIHSAASQHGVSKNLIKAVITIESCFKSKARGAAGEKGLMQLMPGTARRFNVRDGYNVWQNVNGGARYLGLLLQRYDGNTRRAVAAYNAGEGNVRKAGGIPNPAYVGKVMQAYGKFSGTKESALAFQKQVVRPLQVAPATSGKVLPWADLNTVKVASKAVVSAERYKVQPGDTVYQVMRVTGVPVPEIIRLNQLPAPHGIKAGQVLRLR